MYYCVKECKFYTSPGCLGLVYSTALVRSSDLLKVYLWRDYDGDDLTTDLT